MKFKQLFTAVLIIVSIFASAQSGMNWSAIISDDNGSPLKNQSIKVKFTLSHSGAEIYTETHSVTTSERGFVSAIIGKGISTTNFGGVEWKRDFNLKVEVDSGNGYKLVANKPLQSVPYAKYAANGLPKATENQLLNFDGTQWKGVDNLKIIDNETVGINTNQKIASGNLIVSGGTSGSYSGIYANHIKVYGKPFFGFATEGNDKAWIEYDGGTSSFKIFNNDGYKFTIDNKGDVLLKNLEGNSNAPVMVKSDGKLYRGKKETNYIGISGFNFRSYGKKINCNSDNGVYGIESGTFELLAPVNLPHNAILRKLTIHYKDKSTNNLTIYLARLDSNSSANAKIITNFTTSSTTEETGIKTINLNPALNVNKINNLDYYYVIVVSTKWSGNGNMGLRNVVIEYEK